MASMKSTLKDYLFGDKYSRVPSALDSENSDSEKEYLVKDSRRDNAPCRCRGHRTFSICAAVLLTIYTIILAFVLLRPRVSDLHCTKQLSSWSPMLDVVKYETVMWENAFDQESQYRGKPNPERDQAWYDLWRVGDLNVPEEDLKLLNKSEDIEWVHTKPELGGGIQANIEVFHQLHCLDIVRRYTYLDSYAPEDVPQEFKGNDPALVRTHIDHCIDTLRIALMCTSDVTPVLVFRDPSMPLGVSADFHTLHKCRDYDHLRTWYLEHAYTNFQCIRKAGVGCVAPPQISPA